MARRFSFDHDTEVVLPLRHSIITEELLVWSVFCFLLLF